MIVLPPDEVSPEDVKKLEENGICVVVAKNPAQLKFVDPLPAVSSRNQMEMAAIRLSRRLLRGDLFRDNRKDFANLYVDCLVKGTSLDPDQTPEEKEKLIFDLAKAEEIRKLAREEARVERATKKVK